MYVCKKNCPMTKKELLKLDFQLFTERSLIYNTVLLQTILENQITILSKLQNVSQKEITKLTDQRILENINRVNEEIKKKIPEYKKD